MFPLPNDPTTFEFFARYALAGFIVIWVRAGFVTGERPRLTEMAVEAVILSLVNQLAYQFLANWGGQLGFPPPSRNAALMVEVLVLPAVIGGIFGFSLSKGWNLAILRRLSMPIQNPIRRAHDFAFVHNATERFVILTYSDGTRVHGFYGAHSLAANDPARSDIYLERLYDVDESGQWYEQRPSRSALLSLVNMRSIEFLQPKGAEDE